MGATVSNPIALVAFLAMVLAFAGFLGYAWFTRYRMNWDELLRQWSRKRGDGAEPPDDRPEQEPPA